MFVYPRVRIRPEFLDKVPNGATGAASPSGWINEELFSEWFDHFISWSQPKHRPQPGVLIMDGHCSHTKGKGKEQQRYLISLPSQASAIRHSFFQMITKCKLSCGVILEE